jgi:hypothetical protein
MQALATDWDTDKAHVNSGLANISNRVTKTEYGYAVEQQMYAGVIYENVSTASMFRTYADANGSNAIMASNYGLYATVPSSYQDSGDHGKYLYLINEFDKDEDGHCIPYTSAIIYYIDSNGQETTSYSDAVPYSYTQP